MSGMNQQELKKKMEKYQSLYIAYAEANGRSPEDQEKHDERIHNNCMMGFLSWLDDVRQKFWKQYKGDRHSRECHDAWIKYVVKTGKEQGKRHAVAE